ncbi:MAG: DUF4269 domain-containing protein [Pseudomonadota bacterium]
MTSQAGIYAVLSAHNILEKLARFDAVWVGSTALDVHGPDSDIDICCSAKNDLKGFADSLTQLFSAEPNFRIETRPYRGQPSCFASFDLSGQKTEVWGRNHSVENHEFYRFFKVEERLLRFGGDDLRSAVRGLKSEGLSTEQAFARALDLNGDPEEALLALYEADAMTLLALLS